MCLGGLGVLWAPFGAVFGHFEAPPGAFQHEAKSRAHSTSPFFEDVSSEIAIFERGRLKTSSSNSYLFEDVSSETAISEDSKFGASIDEDDDWERTRKIPPHSHARGR